VKLTLSTLILCLKKTVTWTIERLTNVLAQVVVADSGCCHTLKSLGFLQSSQLSRLDVCSIAVHCALSTFIMENVHVMVG
jgi:hypothetical protein